jgi:hypothetical protein
MKKLLFIIFLIAVASKTVHGANPQPTSQESKPGVLYGVGKWLWGYVPAFTKESREHQKIVNDYIQVNKKSQTWKTG